jgi:hypothetical protein
LLPLPAALAARARPAAAPLAAAARTTAAAGTAGTTALAHRAETLSIALAIPPTFARGAEPLGDTAAATARVLLAEPLLLAAE